MIRDIRKTLRSEWYKYRRLRATVALPILLFVVTLGAAYAISKVETKMFAGASAEFVIGATLLSMLNGLAFIAVVVTSFVVSREFTLRTAHAAWIRPIRREGWYLGKVVSVMTAVSALFVLMLAATSIFAAITLKFGSFSLVGHLVAALAVNLLAMLAIVSLAACVATVVNNPAIAIGVCLAIGFCMSIMELIPRTGPYVIPTYVHLPLGNLIAMVKGEVELLEWTPLILKGVACLVGWIALTTGVGVWRIRTREVHN